eukprot:TRINITY_DN67507_c7_g7_i1.p1 TRINITY_DN67507_c7_g7~~TRINITY_DN67507_c7_g7_i1.p1  ORF type:complete len:151 (-),score=2.39 TRINITY_DN67507_c7_g7_i1:32-484(-)
MWPDKVVRPHAWVIQRQATTLFKLHVTFHWNYVRTFVHFNNKRCLTYNPPNHLDEPRSPLGTPENQEQKGGKKMQHRHILLMMYQEPTSLGPNKEKKNWCGTDSFVFKGEVQSKSVDPVFGLSVDAQLHGRPSTIPKTGSAGISTLKNLD